MATVSRERLEKQFHLHLEAPPVCAKRQGMGVNSEAGGGRPKVDGLKLHIPTAAASPSFVLSCFVCARHKP